MLNWIIILIVVIVFIILASMWTGYRLPIIGGAIAMLGGGCCGDNDYDDYYGGYYGGKKKFDGPKDYDFAIHLKEPWIDEVIAGKKTVEGRKNMAPFSNLQSGNIIKFFAGDKSALAEVKKVNQYKNIEEFIEGEDWKKALPGLKKKEEALSTFMEWNKPETVEKYGFLGIHFELLKK